jgi:acetylcholinesterase
MWFDLPWLPLLFTAVNFANTGNPTIPHNSKSLLSNVDWQPWGSSAQHPLLTFLDPAPNVSITFDTYRVDAMNLLNNITLGLASAGAS